ncbi:peptide deformylase [Nonlabens ponticola]|uniref:Peptide deformylase n=1 Tax=Nonlabens ponticola TaxID=2496866 RepID=A0A3S9MUW5_9FLAO|nr:peptide deformylase [Nonlabens ponticola]AZQ42975.1 peptide deformylase [Nonlabens ponticola]
MHSSFFKSISVFVLILVAACASQSQVGSDVFTNQQQELIMQAPSTTPMRVFKITNESDSLLLRQQSSYVKPDPNDKVLVQLIDRMYATVRDSMSLGAGIAAPQVGILKNVVWVQRFDKEGYPFEVFINPVITNYSDEKQDCREGCLSIPNRTDTLTMRAKTVLVKYDNLEQTNIVESITDFTAVVVQHEVDHLRGILYLDHLKDEQKKGLHF